MRPLPLVPAIAVLALAGCQLLLGIETRAVDADGGAFGGGALDGGALDGGDGSSADDGPRPEASTVSLSDAKLDDVDATGPSGAFAPRTGDVVVLEPGSIQTTTRGELETWNDRTAGSTRRAVANGTAPAVTSVGGLRCLSFNGGEYLRMIDDGTLGPGESDFSVLVILKPDGGPIRNNHGSIPVARAESTGITQPGGWRYSYRGFALMTEVSDVDTRVSKRFSARLAIDYEAKSVSEVLEPTRPLAEHSRLTATALQRMGDKLYLHVDRSIHEAIATGVQPAKANLLVGKVDEDDDLVATAYRGLVCAVVLHHGPETVGAVQARLAAMRSAFPP